MTPRARPRLEVVNVEGPAEAFRLWREQICRYIRHLGVPPRSVDDATQDVFIIACRKWLDFEGRSTRKVWVYGIATRVAHQHRRHAQYKDSSGDFSTVEHTLTEAQWGTTPPGPFDCALTSEASHTLELLLRSLPESHRDILVLIDFEGQTHAEAAAVLGLTVKAVERRLNRARANFNQAVQRYRARDARRL